MCKANPIFLRIVAADHIAGGAYTIQEAAPLARTGSGLRGPRTPIELVMMPERS
jgi:hypothetical protein